MGVYILLKTTCHKFMLNRC